MASWLKKKDTYYSIDTQSITHKEDRAQIAIQINNHQSPLNMNQNNTKSVQILLGDTVVDENPLFWIRNLLDPMFIPDSGDIGGWS